ncbi:lipid A export ATP-binding/permease protein MsbA [Citreicella sp. SE45]|nr:lipid A export ATP-binding/permease protein MsbA [Citreicella sp. SE45]
MFDRTVKIETPDAQDNAAPDAASAPAPASESESKAARKKRRSQKSRQRIRALILSSLRSQSKTYIIAILAMVVGASGAALTAWVMEGIVDAMNDSGNMRRVFSVSVTVAAIFTVKGLASYVQAVFMTRAGNRIVAMLQIRFYEQLLRQGVAFFNVNESSSILLHSSRSAQKARQIIDLVVTSFVRDILTLCGLIFVMFWQQPVLTLVALVIGPILMVVVRVIIKRVRAIVEKETSSLTEILKVTQETAAGFAVIKLFGLEDRMAARMNTAVRQVEERSNAVARMQAITSPLVETLSGLVIAAVVMISAIDLFDGQPTTPGQLMSFITALLMAYEPAKRLTRLRVRLEALIKPVHMMFDLIETPPAIGTEDGTRDLVPGPGEIEMRGVSFGYREGQDVLRALDLRFEAGKTTALVGPSGSGKSTILQLLMRLYDPTSGEVVVDGQDLRRIAPKSLHRTLSYVGQETFLFSTTVMDNLRVARPDASDEEVIAAARNANAHDFISALPQGYQTEVGENGALLSGGQRQRLAIARAFLRSGRILLLDEATSALDADSERLIREAMQRVSRETTTVVIAHRLSTVMDAHRIHFIEDGQVIQSGSPSELLQADGPFRVLFEQQFGGMVQEA